MHLSWLLALSGGAVASIPAIAARNQPQTVCDKFKSMYSNITYSYGDANYDEESEDTWSTRSWLKPACIFAPVNAEQLSFAVTNLAECGVKFAIRGGGHMPIASANGIGSEGVLISCTNLDTLALSSDNKTLSVGPGPRWTEVYTALDGTGYGVVGARIGPVGVPGFLLGGGVSFYSYEHGLGSTNGNVKGYQCVLADGRVVEVTVDNEFADLFWALQGGGNSFCLVTRFDIQTHPSPTVMIGAPTYGSTEIRDKFMDTVFDFVTNGHLDPKAAIIPVCRYDSGNDAPVYSSTLFYNGNDTVPAILNGFLGGNLEPENGVTALSPFPLGQYSTAVSQAFEEGGESHGKRQRFHMLPILANREALQKAHDLFFELAKTSFDGMNATIGMAFNPITSQFLKASNAKPGSLQGLDERPAFWIEQTYTWEEEGDDVRIENFIQGYNTNILETLRSMNATASFHYLNEADEGQPVFESYPAGNLDRLKQIRAKYDPTRVFTDLMPGGWKVEAA